MRPRLRVVDLRAAVGFLTVVRWGPASPPTPGAVPLFAVVGALVGVGVGSVWTVADWWWGPALAAALALVADLALTGLLHVDGLADSGDGLVAPLPPDRRLAAMADPAVGAFGVVVVVATLIVRFAAFATATPSMLAVGAIWATSRTVMGLAVLSRPHARPDGGLGAGFVDRRSSTPAGSPGPEVVLLGSGAALALVLGATGAGLVGIVAVVATAAAAAGVVAFGERRVGGWTGDVLGAAGVVGETIGLVVLAGDW